MTVDTGRTTAVDLAECLSPVLEQRFSEGARVEHLRRMTAGASRITWSFDAVTPVGV